MIEGIECPRCTALHLLEKDLDETAEQVVKYLATLPKELMRDYLHKLKDSLSARDSTSVYITVVEKLLYSIYQSPIHSGPFDCTGMARWDYRNSPDGKVLYQCSHCGAVCKEMRVACPLCKRIMEVSIQLCNTQDNIQRRND